MYDRKTSGGNILVIDDKLENLRVLDLLLTDAGYEVRPAPNARLGLLTAQRKSPDLILLDIRMPGMDGYEVCEHLKADKRTRDIPVIFISAPDETIDKASAFSVGGADYITKPFHKEEVLARVETHLDLMNMQKRLEAQNARLVQEIAEHRRTEEALRESKKAANAANQAKNAFLRSVSHELRTPLNAILGFSKLMSGSRKISPQHRDQAATIYRKGEHLLTLVNKVIGLTRGEADRAALDMEDFELDNLIEDVYAGHSVENENPESNILTFNRIQALPQEWLAALQNAAERTDPRGSDAVIQQIRKQDEPLAEALAALVRKYRFDIIQELFEETRS